MKCQSVTDIIAGKKPLDCCVHCWFQISNAVEALKACVAKLKQQKKDLFALGDNEHIFLQFAFKKISLQRQTAKVYVVYCILLILCCDCFSIVVRGVEIYDLLMWQLLSSLLQSMFHRQ